MKSFNYFNLFKPLTVTYSNGNGWLRSPLKLTRMSFNSHSYSCPQENNLIAHLHQLNFMTTKVLIANKDDLTFLLQEKEYRFEKVNRIASGCQARSNDYF
jgi:hypothetical protein